MFHWLRRHLLRTRKRRSNNNDNNNNASNGFPLKDLPDDIVINILSKLPLRCILNLQTVCKKWLALTSSSNFAQIHFKSRASSQISKNNELDLFLFDEESERYKLVKIMRNGYVKVTAHVCPMLVGSFKGFLVFQMSLGSQYLVWDLVTRENTYIHAPESSSDHPLSLTAIFFHPSAQEGYKLLFSSQLSDAPDYKYEFFIYESTNTMWRKLSNSSYPPMSSIDQAVVNPTIYKNFLLWMAPSDMKDRNHIPHCRSSVVIYDMDVESFRSMPHPGDVCGYNRIWHKDMYFFEVQGQLYFCHLRKSGVFVWTLEMYDSWYWAISHEVRLDYVKMMKISSRSFPLGVYLYDNVKLIKIEDYTIFFRCRYYGLFVYDTLKKTLTKLDKARNARARNNFTYSESSLSLESGFRCRTIHRRLIHKEAREYNV